MKDNFKRVLILTVIYCLGFSHAIYSQSVYRTGRSGGKFSGMMAEAVVGF